MKAVDRMRAATLAYTMRGYLDPLYPTSERLDLLRFARQELATIGVKDVRWMTYTDCLTTAELLCGERTVQAA